MSNDNLLTIPTTIQKIANEIVDELVETIHIKMKEKLPANYQVSELFFFIVQCLAAKTIYLTKFKDNQNQLECTLNIFNEGVVKLILAAEVNKDVLH